MLRLAVFLLPCVAVAEPPEVEPTDLEAFVSNPNVVVGHEQPIGELDSLDSSVRIVAIEAEDVSKPGMTRRGARIDLTNNAWNASVYLDEAQLAELWTQLAMMSEVGGQHDNGERPLVPHVFGTELCWMPDTPQRILCPSYRRDQAGETLFVAVYGDQVSFPLPGHDLADLAAVIETASERISSEGVFEDDSQVDDGVEAAAAGKGPEEKPVPTAAVPDTGSADAQTPAVTSKSAERESRAVWLVILIAALVAGFVVARYTLRGKRSG